MSWSSSPTILPGDLVILWLKRGVLEHITITEGKEYNGRFGAYRHSDLVGLPYGSRVHSRNNLGFIHVLRPTPELWTLTLPHRTQILYMPDIAFVTSHLNIRPHSRVAEAGTGSGSFSHSALRTIGNQGHLFSFEFHQGREIAARKEFSTHGFSDNVTLTHRNVCKDGFQPASDVDAVFLDLPAPWLAVPHLTAILNRQSTSRVCCFSPCMEQVTKTVAALNDHGFSDISMFECLLRPHDVSTIPKPSDISQAVRRLQEADVKKEERRQRQIANAIQRNNAAKRKREEETGGAVSGTYPAEDQGGSGEGSVKRLKTGSTTTTGGTELDSSLSIAPSATLQPDPPESPPTSVVSRVIPEVRGHTSYLTFASKLPHQSSSQ